MNSMTFLGTGGGRRVMFSQIRATGGIYFDLDGIKFIVDPGPGSLVNMRNLKLKDPRGILLSHYHIDHCSDANPILDGIEKPFLIAEEHCIKGDKYNFPCIGKYHQEKCNSIQSVKAGDDISIPGSKIRIAATKAIHSSPAIGFVIVGSKKIGYPADTIYFKGMEKPFEGCDAIIFNVLVPKGKIPDENRHLGTEGSIKFLNDLENKPKLAILQHFSFWMINNSIQSQAKSIEKATGIMTIAAKDFMTIDMDEMKKTGLENFM